MDAIAELETGPRTLSTAVSVATGTNNINRNVADMLRTYVVNSQGVQTVTLTPEDMFELQATDILIISTTEPVEVITDGGSLMVRKMIILDSVGSQVIIANHGPFEASVRIVTAS